MRRAKTAILAAAGAMALFSATQAAATAFDFSYTFDTGQTITGSFDGTGTPAAGITNITDITASLDGTPLSGPLNAFSYTDAGGDCSTCWTLGGAVVTANALNSNFAFVDATSTAGLLAGTYTNYFYVIPWPNGASDPEATQFYNVNGTYSGGNNGAGDHNIDYYNGDLVTANWSVTFAPVPEPAAWALMLVGLAGLGAMLRGRRRLAIA